MTDPRPRRSALFLPASNARAVEKARGLPCDVVILDLEDAVGPEGKTQARAAAVAAVAVGFGPRETVVRVNGLDTPWGQDDLEAMRAAAPDAVLIPKLAAATDLALYASALGDVRLWAMIETCAALMNLAAIGDAAAENRLDLLVIGPNDLAREMRCRLGVERTPLLGPLSICVAAARAHGLSILDGVFNDFADADGLARQCQQGADFGFDGKTLIHPSQIAPANTAFAPDAAALDWSRKVAAAFDSPENAGKGVLSIEGRMVERLHLEEARRLVALAQVITAREAG